MLANRTLTGVCGSKTASAAARASAAPVLLDRGWGKASQPRRQGHLRHHPKDRLGRATFQKLEDHDIRAPILGMSREVALSCDIRILCKITTHRRDLPRTVLLAPPLDQVNCVR